MKIKDDRKKKKREKASLCMPYKIVKQQYNIYIESQNH